MPLKLIKIMKLKTYELQLCLRRWKLNSQFGHLIVVTSMTKNNHHDVEKYKNNNKCRYN
jgi:hypothetical protein